jgi:uncharacterized protein YbaP (TraB family)
MQEMINGIRNILLVLAFSFGFVAEVQSLDTNDRALFWSVESESGHAGYLLGTIHSEDPRVLEYTETFLAALSSCSRFAMELVPNLPTLARLAETMHLPEDTHLASLIGEQRFNNVATAMSVYGIPESQAARMKPWAAMITLSVPAPKTGFFMDFSLSLRASGSGVEVIGLETLDEQLGFLENMPLEHLLTMLDQAVAEASKVQEVHDQMVTSYLSEDLSLLTRDTEEQLSLLGDEARDYFMTEGISVRNHRMMDRLREALSEGTVFTAVGALHLPGEEGLIALLRNEGYQLRPLPSPFPELQAE